MRRSASAKNANNDWACGSNNEYTCTTWANDKRFFGYQQGKEGSTRF